VAQWGEGEGHSREKERDTVWIRRGHSKEKQTKLGEEKGLSWKKVRDRRGEKEMFMIAEGGEAQDSRKKRWTQRGER